MDIFSVLILFGVASMVFRLIKKAGQAAKQAQTQAAGEAAKPFAVPKPAPKREDYRFPSAKKPEAKAPVFQEGGPKGLVQSSYTPITPSADLNSQFSEYKGSIDTAVYEGVGYHTEAYDAVTVPYRANQGPAVKVLPDVFTRDTLLQAVVMAEVLKRPGERR